MESLCAACRHVRRVVSPRGSRFLMCGLSQGERRYPKYPRQPVLRCDGYEQSMTTMMRQPLNLLSGEYAVVRLDAGDALPTWAAGEFVSITRTADELSVVCRREAVPAGARSETNWRCLQVVGPLEFTLVGVIAGLTGVLAAKGLGVFVVSTFDTDYLLVKEAELEAAVAALDDAGHTVRNPEMD